MVFSSKEKTGGYLRGSDAAGLTGTMKAVKRGAGLNPPGRRFRLRPAFRCSPCQPAVWPPPAAPFILPVTVVS